MTPNRLVAASILGLVLSTAACATSQPVPERANAPATEGGGKSGTTVLYLPQDGDKLADVQFKLGPGVVVATNPTEYVFELSDGRRVRMSVDGETVHVISIGQP